MRRKVLYAASMVIKFQSTTPNNDEEQTKTEIEEKTVPVRRRQGRRQTTLGYRRIQYMYPLKKVSSPRL